MKKCSKIEVENSLRTSKTKEGDKVKKLIKITPFKFV